jgi:hypothetical protein
MYDARVIEASERRISITVKRDVKPIVAIVAVVALAIVGLMALRGTSRTVEVHPPVDIGSPGDTTPSGGPIATVIAKREVGGGSILWFSRGDPTYIVSVQFFAGADCIGLIDDDTPWPTDDPSCTSEVPISGTVSGGGIAITGEAIVAVDAIVQQACYDAIDPGRYWPPEGLPCP